MTTHNKLLILILSVLSIGQVHSQTVYFTCQIHTVNSQNNNFFLKTIPFDNIEQTNTGKTIIFNKDSSEIYQIPIHFEVSKNRKELFLSNDGKTIAYVIDREFNWAGIENKSVQIFKEGKPFKEFRLMDLIKCDSDNEDCFLFYKEAIDSITWKSGTRVNVFKENAEDFQKQLTKKATFVNNDTLYIFAKTDKLIKIELNTINLTVSPINEVEVKKINLIKQPEVKSEKFKSSSLFGLPNLSNGQSFEEALAEHLGMSVFLDEKKNSHKYKRHSLYIEIIVDTSGNSTLDKTDDYGELSEDKIKTFVESQRFATNSIPNETEKWRFKGWVKFMNKSKKEAQKERQLEIAEEYEEYKKRIIGDSINGVYIPKNLEECFIELDRLLKPKEITAIKDLKDRNETILYHHGFGTWLRNNWGLWGGSRLQQYLIEKGVNHPDDMSSIILKFYYDWLNGQNEEWENFEHK